MFGAERLKHKQVSGVYYLIIFARSCFIITVYLFAKIYSLYFTVVTKIMDDWKGTELVSYLFKKNLF
jgi:hypothetical protein